MAGTYIIRTGPMHSPTGGVTLYPSPTPPEDVEGANASSSGSAQIPIPADPTLYLDGSDTPTLFDDLPSGWTPDSVYVLHCYTFCNVAGDTAQFTISALSAVGVVTATGLQETNIPLTGMTLVALLSLAGSTIVFDATVVSIVTVRNFIVPSWDDVANVSIVGSYVSTTPFVTSVTPPAGTVNGGSAVTIRGRGFTAGTAAKFDGVIATSFVVLNDTTATAVTPEHVSGVVDVEVVGVATGLQLYTYVIPAVLLPPMPSRTPIRTGRR